MLFKFGRYRRTSRRRNATLAGQVQCLEGKSLLTGIVTVVTNAAGDVTITGDNKDNEIVIHVNDDGVFIQSADNRTKIKLNNGTAAVALQPVQLSTNETTVNSIKIDLKNGDDFVGIVFDSNSEGFTTTVNKDISILLGNGDDFLGIDCDQGIMLNVTGAFKIDTGAGSDEVDFDFASLDVTAAFSLLTGAGSDYVEGELSDFEAASVSFDTGADSDVLDVIISGVANIGFSSGSSTGGLTVKTGNEDDFVSFIVEDVGALSVSGSALFDLGADDDLLVLGNRTTIEEALGSGDPAVIAEDEFIDAGDFDVDGSLTITTGAGDDFLAIARLTVGVDLIVTTGADDDTVAATELNAVRDLTLKTEAGNDRIAANFITVGRSTIVDTGAGNDSIAIDEYFTGNTVNSKLDIKLQAGDDELAVGALELGDGIGTRVTVDGGAGIDDLVSETDLLDVNPATGVPILGFEGDEVDGEGIAADVIAAINDALDDEDFFE